MNLEQRAKKLIKDLKITKDYILERSAKPDGILPYGELLELLRDNGIPKTSGAEIADKIMEILDIKNEKPVKASTTLVVADATLGNDSALAMALFDLLKNTRELEYMAHQFHWNIIGVKFNTMHEFYEEEYKQLFEDQDEIAEQIRQQGFFVPVINNVLLEENYSASGFEEQLITYSGKLAQNMTLIDKVNDLAKNEIAVQDLCARLRGLRGLSLNLKVRAMLGGNKMSLESSEATAAAVTAGRIAKFALTKEQIGDLKSLGFKLDKGNYLYPSVSKKENGMTVTVTYTPSLAPYKFRVSKFDSEGKLRYESARKNLDDLIEEMKDRLHKQDVTASAVTAAKELFKKGDIVNISGDISSNGYNVRVSSTGVVEENQKTYNSKVLVNIDEIDGDRKVSMFVNPKIITLASAVTAGFDKGRYKEIDEESKFFKILKNDCDIRAKNFYAINKGLRLAIKVIKGTFEDASIRFFALKNKGGYVRVELKDKVYIVGYTIYESGKIKVWTRELKTNVPVNSFDYDMLNMYAKPFGTKMVTGMLPTWMSI